MQTSNTFFILNASFYCHFSYVSICGYFKRSFSVIFSQLTFAKVLVFIKRMTLLFLYLVICKFNDYAFADVGQTNTIDFSDIASQEQLTAWVHDIGRIGVNLPFHRRGATEGEKKTATYIQEQLHLIGIENIRRQSFETKVRIYTKWNFTINDIEIPSYFINGSAFTDLESGVEADLVYIKESNIGNVNVKGKIVAIELTRGALEGIKTKSFSNWVHDPKGTLKNGTFGSKAGALPANFPSIYYEAVRNRAVAVIAILKEYDTNSNKLYPDNHGIVTSDILGLFLSKSEGEKLRALTEASEQPVRARIKVEGHINENESANLIVHFPGKTRDSILISTHYDAGFEGGVQSASGIAALLGLAKYYQTFPVTLRQKNILIVFYGAHFGYSGPTGAESFLKENYSMAKSIAATVHIENIAKKMVISEGVYTDTTETEPRLFFTPANSMLISQVKQAMQFHKLYDTLLVKPGALPLPHSIRPLYLEGVPSFAITSYPEYLFFPDDTVDKVDMDEFFPLLKTITVLVNQLVALPAAWIKAVDQLTFQPL